MKTITCFLWIALGVLCIVRGIEALREPKGRAILFGDERRRGPWAPDGAIRNPDQIPGLVYWAENGKTIYITKDLDKPNETVRFFVSENSAALAFYDRTLTAEEIKLVSEYVAGIGITRRP